MAKVNLLQVLDSEIKTNLSQLLMVEIENVSNKNIDSSELLDDKFATVYVKFSFSTFVSHLYFYVSTGLSTLIEHLMLGAMMEQKTELDDEILDAIKEVISTITGSTATTLNTTAKSELGTVKFEIQDISINDKSSIDISSKLLSFDFSINDQEHSIILKYDEILERLLDNDSEENSKENDEVDSDATEESSNSSKSKESNSDKPESNQLSLSNEAIENLKLLFDIELKVSVRLGTKKLLLRDIVKMDIGHIIELDQLVNEPLDILLNGVKIAEGNAVVVDGKFGILIKHIGSKRDRINQIQLG